jgi:hypothetical protein
VVCRVGIGGKTPRRAGQDRPSFTAKIGRGSGDMKSRRRSLRSKIPARAGGLRRVSAAGDCPQFTTGCWRTDHRVPRCPLVECRRERPRCKPWELRRYDSRRHGSCPVGAPVVERGGSEAVDSFEPGDIDVQIDQCATSFPFRELHGDMRTSTHDPARTALRVLSPWFGPPEPVSNASHR